MRSLSTLNPLLVFYLIFYTYFRWISAILVYYGNIYLLLSKKALIKINSAVKSSVIFRAMFTQLCIN